MLDVFTIIEEDVQVLSYNVKSKKTRLHAPYII